MNKKNTSEQHLLNDHEWVDLGLPSGTCWATCNVGANNPEECGDYYAWGEIEYKSQYEDYNSKTLHRDIYNIGNNERYDAARHKWGEGWRLPTYTECKELCQNCSFTLTQQNNVWGYKVTGLNGNSIFLPGVGCCFRGSVINMFNAQYWSSKSDFYESGECLYLTPQEFSIRSYERYYGLSIRPVCHPNEESEKVNTEEKNNIYQERIHGIVHHEQDSTDNVDNGCRWVDLGLPSGTLWGECNIGAKRPDECGYYFAWGETQNKTSYSKGNCNTIGLRQQAALNAFFDAAHRHCGDNWQTPSPIQLKELCECCKWTWMSVNGANGYQVTGINGNSIFLPATGYRYDQEWDERSTYGYYWSNTPDHDFTSDALLLCFNYNSHHMSSGNRCYGRCIRAVKK